MRTTKAGTPDQWTSQWLDSVADGSRTLSLVESRGCGIEAARVIAEQKGVYLLFAEDDKGNEFVAASTKPFTVLC